MPLTTPPIGRPIRTMPAHASRRTFLSAAAAGLAGASCAPRRPAVAGSPAQDAVPDGRRRVLLRGGVVLSLDPKVGDFEQADVLIDGKRIAAVGPNLQAGDALVVDCTGTIVMPGFITTHHHQYETLQRSLIPDGLLAGAWPLESYESAVQSVWTAGRIADPANPGRFVWDLGRVPCDPEDGYIAQLVACLSEISEGVTTGTDVSQASHTPEHTDAMIKGLMDSGRRMVYAYTGGTNRSAEGIPYEFPGAIDDATKGIGRIAKTYFSSRDQLVTLGLQLGGGPGVRGRGVHRLAAGPFVRRRHHRPQRRQPGGGRAGRRRRPERHRLVRRHVHPRHAVAGHAAGPGRIRHVRLPEGQPIEGVGDRARPRAPTSRLRRSSRCRCGTGCRPSRSRSTTASCPA